MVRCTMYNASYVSQSYEALLSLHKNRKIYLTLYAVVQHIPISLLELNTCGHAFCALLIYILWWEKPFEVDYPSMIEGPILWDMRAFHWMQRNQSTAARSFVRDLSPCLEGDQWFQALSDVSSRHLSS